MPTFRELLHLPTSPANFSRFTCQLLVPTFREQPHLPTSCANFSRATSPANLSCQLVESYCACQLLMPTCLEVTNFSCQLLESNFTCQLLMPTCRELLHLPTCRANLSRVISPSNFSCQLFGCYLVILASSNTILTPNQHYGLTFRLSCFEADYGLGARSPQLEVKVLA